MSNIRFRHGSLIRDAGGYPLGGPLGFTLLEAIIALALLATVVILVSSALLEGDKAYWEESSRTQLEATLSNNLDEVVGLLRETSPGTFTPSAPMGAPLLQYRVVVGFASGAPVWSDPRTAGFEYDPMELDNGVDDDGDGYVDEGKVALRDPVAGTERILPGVAAEGGFTVTRTGDRLSITMQMQERIGDSVETVDAMTELAMRNTGGSP